MERAKIMGTNTAEKLEFEETENPLAIELYNSAMALKVIDEVTMTTAGNILISIKDNSKASIVAIDDQIKEAHAKHKRLCDIKNRILKPFQDAEKYLRDQVNKYQTKIMLERQEAERKARIANEEAARKAQAKLVDQAARAEEKGQTGKAEELLEKAEQVVPAPVAIEAPPKTQQVANGSVTAKTDLDVVLPTDEAGIREVCRAIAEGNMPVTCVKLEPAKIKAWAKMMSVQPGKRFGIIFRQVAACSVRKGAA
ncbi:MAG: hypothetical protein WC900_10420 [Oscillospiraceae bacterium]|jgi:hypothetical protein